MTLDSLTKLGALCVPLSTQLIVAIYVPMDPRTIRRRFDDDDAEALLVLRESNFAGLENHPQEQARCLALALVNLGESYLVQAISSLDQASNPPSMGVLGAIADTVRSFKGPFQPESLADEVSRQILEALDAR